MKKKAILVVSYGSSYKESREKSIGGIEQAIRRSFPEYAVFRAFTSNSIIERIQKKEGIKTDTIREAFERALAEGVEELTVLQTHLVKGTRYEALAETVELYQSKFKRIKVANPILSDDVNVTAFADVMEQLAERYDDGNTAICYVGHGIEETSKIAYEKLQTALTLSGYTNYYVGTLSVKPTMEDIKREIEVKDNYKRVIIIPLMLVSGYHVRKDLIGHRPGTWEDTFLQAGYAVECVQKGLGEEPMIQNMFVEHIKSAIL